MRVCNAGEFARIAFMRSGIHIKEDFIDAVEEDAVIAKAIEGENYFGNVTYSDIQEITKAVHRMRMLVDEADYENIGGDSYLSGFVKGFEVVPYPYLVNVMGLPKEVGNSYQGPTLFTVDEKGNYKANYKESLDILKYLFPKDKTIFLMCGGGGYAGMTKNLLVANGWDKDKIYNVGGYWYYDGKNTVNIKRSVNGGDVYDFWKVTYHDIDFDRMTEVHK